MSTGYDATFVFFRVFPWFGFFSFETVYPKFES